MKGRQVTVAIADDHEIYRDGLQLLLSRDASVKVCGEAENGADLISLLEENKVDVVLTDLRMPVMDGIAVIKHISEKFPHTRCIALSTFDNEHLIVEALEAGAMGYIIKNAKKGEIIEAIHTVSGEMPYYCDSTSTRLIKMISGSSFNPYRRKEIQKFTQREIEIIRLICREKSSKEISETLFLSPRTVESIRAGILEKMKVKTPAGVAIYAIKNGLFSLESV